MDASAKAGPHPPGSANELYWRVEITGDLIECKAQFLRPPRGLPKRRGTCKGFTRASRLRMLKMVSKIDWKNITRGLFITLTLPDACWPMDSSRRTQARHVFLRDLERRLGKPCGALWRIEWQKRQSGVNRGKFLPHFHLIIPGVQFVPWQFINDRWKAALGHRGIVVTDVRRLSDKSMHQVYIAKYAAKLPSLSSLDYLSYLNIDGRHWGVHRPSLIPKHKTVVYDGLSDERVEALKSLAREKFSWYGEYAELGFSMFGKLGAKMVEAVRQLCVDNLDAD